MLPPKQYVGPSWPGLNQARFPLQYLPTLSSKRYKPAFQRRSFNHWTTFQCCLHRKPGASANVCDSQTNNTPLELAAAKCDVEIDKALIEGGADITTKNRDGHTPLMCAV